MLKSGSSGNRLDGAAPDVDTVYMSAGRSTKKVDSDYIRKAGKPRKDYHHGDLRAAVLEAAEQMLEDQGIENLSLRDVAGRIGVSHAAPYRHFPKKIDLLMALAEQGFNALGNAMEEAFEARTPRLRLELSGILYVRLAVAHPVRTQLMFSKTIQCDEAPASLREAGDRAFSGLVRIIGDGQQSGAFQPDKDPGSLALGAWSVVHGLAALISGGQLEGRNVDQLVKEVLAQFYDGIANRSS